MDIDIVSWNAVDGRLIFVYLSEDLSRRLRRIRTVSFFRPASQFAAAERGFGFENFVCLLKGIMVKVRRVDITLAKTSHTLTVCE